MMVGFSADEMMLRCFALSLGLAIDGIFADFRPVQPFISHPVILIGKLIGWCEKKLNDPDRGSNFVQIIKGFGVVVFILLVCAFFGYGVGFLASFDGVVQIAVEGFFIGWLIALRSLLGQAKRVGDLMQSGDLMGAKKALCWLAGRKADHLDPSMLRLAVIESVVESFCDAVVAPVFWYLVFGLPGLFAYKALNTLDSMIGHRSVDYRYFGKASAIGDDIANFIPARITAILFCFAALPFRQCSAFDGIYGLWAFSPNIFTYLRQRWHGETLASVNAVVPQAVVSSILGLRLGGERLYQEAGDSMARITVSFVGDGRKKAEKEDFETSLRLTWSAWCFLCFGVVFSGLLLWVRMN